MTNSYLITNARIVNEGTITEGDLLIENGRISGLGKAAPAGTARFDAAGAWLLPGMIDDQVHFREPGLEHKGTIATESRAAVVSTPGLVEPAEPLEDHFSLTLGDARAVILDGEQASIVVGGERHLHPPCRMTVGVVDQVADESAELIRRTGHRQPGRGHQLHRTPRTSPCSTSSRGA